MISNFCRLWLSVAWIGAVLVPAFAGAGTSPNKRDMSMSAGGHRFSVPVLTVSTRDGGQFSRLPFSFDRSRNGQPLKVLIADDTPSGAGDSIRSSVWLAAVTAAMQRSDPMDGVRMTVEFSGHIDGPSAGGVLCLAMLSALDGKAIPRDFAMTGTVMPDGTIGAVGGVAKKVKAAIAAGCRRICIPSTIRFEEDGDELVDLFRLGDGQGAEVRPVSSIDEAYAFCHSLPMPAPVVIDEGRLLALPKPAEDRLIQASRGAEARIKKIRASLDNEVLSALESDDELRKLLLDDTYISQFCAGRMLSAWNSLRGQELLWMTVPGLIESVGESVERCPALGSDSGYAKEDLPAMVKELQECKRRFSKKAAQVYERAVLKGIPRARGWVRSSPEYGAISAQAEDSLMVEAAGALLSADYRSPDDEQIAAATVDNIGDCFESMVSKEFLYLFCDRIDEGGEDLPTMTIFKDYPKPDPNPSVGTACKLFHSACSAVDASLKADIFSEEATSAKSTSEEITDILSAVDHHFAAYRLAGSRSQTTYQWMENRGDLGDPSYHEVAQLISDARLLASACTFLVKYGADLGWQSNDDGSCQCRHPEFLNNLVRRARRTAMESMEVCRRAEIPYPESIAAFEEADGVDVSACDAEGLVHDVLQNYWTAGLTAKALLIGFRHR